MTEGIHFEYTIWALIIVPLALIHSEHVFAYNHRSAESGNQMISTTNKMYKKPWWSYEFINLNGLNTTLVITVSMQWSNTVV